MLLLAPGLSGHLSAAPLYEPCAGISPAGRRPVAVPAPGANDSIPAPGATDSIPPAGADSISSSGANADSAAAEAPLGKGGRKGDTEVGLSSGKALLYSAIIPGGGQFYNRKYWKIPIVYGGFVALGVAIEFNQRYYSEFVRELNYRGDGDPLTEPKYDETAIPNSRIIEARNYYRRYRDLCIIGVGVMYGLNIVDAYVDAELSNFDISEDLSLRFNPYLDAVPSATAAGRPAAAAGLSLTLQFNHRKGIIR